jgi:hypothetical protein
MVSSGLLRRVALVRTDVSSETSVLTRATRRYNPEDTILHSHRPENLKSYNNNIICNIEILDTLLDENYKRT